MRTALRNPMARRMLNLRSEGQRGADDETGEERKTATGSTICRVPADALAEDIDRFVHTNCGKPCDLQHFRRTSRRSMTCEMATPAESAKLISLNINILRRW